jgi:hypothetical protein
MYYTCLSLFTCEDGLTEYVSIHPALFSFSAAEDFISALFN